MFLNNDDFSRHIVFEQFVQPELCRAHYGTSIVAEAVCNHVCRALGFVILYEEIKIVDRGRIYRKYVLI